MAIGGRVQALESASEPKYTTIYVLESPEVLVSEGWARAIEQGRWPADVRPHTRNRRHILLQRLG
jgi:hypothetical protein